MLAMGVLKIVKMGFTKGKHGRTQTRSIAVDCPDVVQLSSFYSEFRVRES